MQGAMDMVPAPYQVAPLLEPYLSPVSPYISLHLPTPPLYLAHQVTELFESFDRDNSGYIDYRHTYYLVRVR